MTLTRLIELSLQKNVTRIVVGEVVGEEVMAMMEAMQGGRGSISTVHAHSALDTVERLVTLITRARSNVDTSFGYRPVAQNVDLVVHVGLVDESHLPGGRKWRHVDEVVALEVSRDTHVAHTRIFEADEFGRARPTGQLPQWISDIERHGFDAGWPDPSASTGPSARAAHPAQDGLMTGLAIIAALGLAVAITLIAAGLTTPPPAPARPRARRRQSATFSPVDRRNLAIGGVVGLLLALYGWVIALIILPVFAVALRG